MAETIKGSITIRDLNRKETIKIATISNRITVQRVDSTAPIIPTNTNRSKAVAVAVAAVVINTIEVGTHVSKAAGHSKVMDMQNVKLSKNSTNCNHISTTHQMKPLNQ